MLHVLGGTKRMMIRAFNLMLAGLGLVGSLNATPLSGQFNLNGSAKITLTSFDWLPVGGPTGVFRTTDPATGSFLGISDPFGNFTGIEKDLKNPPYPVDVPILVTAFLSGFTSPVLAPNGRSFSTLIFDLTKIRASPAAECTGFEIVNFSCSVGGPFPPAITLKNTGSGTEVDFAFEGYFQFTGDATTSTFGSGLYTAQLTGVSIQTVLLQLAQPSGIDAAYSANFAASPSSVPEPTTITMFLAGLMLIGTKSVRVQSKK